MYNNKFEFHGFKILMSLILLSLGFVTCLFLESFSIGWFISMFVAIFNGYVFIGTLDEVFRTVSKNSFLFEKIKDNLEAIRTLSNESLRLVKNTHECNHEKFAKIEKELAKKQEKKLPPLEVSLEEIAEKYGVDKKNLKIKY